MSPPVRVDNDTTLAYAPPATLGRSIAMERNWSQTGEELVVKDLSTSELAELRQSFDSVDRNGDGSIASSEFRELLQELDHDLSDDECLLAFELTDSDGDGVISFEEFMSWWTGD